MIERDQSRRRLLRSLALLACCGTVSAVEAADKWVEGSGYFRIQPTQPVSTWDKIEVLDVFSYACSACNAFESTLKELEAALPAYAQIAYLAAGFNLYEDWPAFQRAFLTAQMLGVADRSHEAMYDAVWGKGSLAISDKATGRLLPRVHQPSIAKLAGFYSHYGVTERAFLHAANSSAVDSLIARADVRLAECGVDSTPTLIINGRYRLTPASAGGYSRTIDLVLFLVARERARQKGL